MTERFLPGDIVKVIKPVTPSYSALRLGAFHTIGTASYRLCNGWVEIEDGSQWSEDRFEFVFRPPPEQAGQWFPWNGLGNNLPTVNPTFHGEVLLRKGSGVDIVAYRLHVTAHTTLKTEIKEIPSMNLQPDDMITVNMVVKAYDKTLPSTVKVSLPDELRAITIAVRDIVTHTPRPLAAGDHVTMNNPSDFGSILAISSKKAWVCWDGSQPDEVVLLSDLTRAMS